ncbi:hypothetical protein FQN55_006976 [Onygenales sp. PD_40]|nr:hypothetical protein FQN55_006976 [Onygenales sp. PD_40]
MAYDPPESNNGDEVAAPPDPSIPPDGGYGWVIVAACFSLNCFSWGVVSTYGVYLAEYLSHNRFPEATSVDYALIGGFIFSVAMLFAPLITIIAREAGVRPTMFIGTLFFGGGFIAASFSKRLWQLYISQGIMLGLGVGFTYVPNIAIISQWFDKKRSLANGITGAGSGIGGLVFSFMTDAIIRRISLEWAFRVTAIIVIVMLLLATALIRTRNEAIRPPQRGFDSKLLRRADVLLVLSWSFISMLGYMTLLYSLPDYGRSIGLSKSQAASVNAILNLGTAIGRPLIGISSDRFGRLQVAGVLTGFCGLICFAIWIPGTSYGVLILFALISGGILGVFWVSIGPVCVEVAGLAELQSVLSLSWVSVVLPTMFSEVIALKLRRPNSDREYLYPQIFAGVSYIVASIYNYFPDTLDPTLELNYRKQIHTGNKHAIVELLDISMMDLSDNFFRAMWHQMLLTGDVYILLYDVTCRQDFDAMPTAHADIAPVYTSKLASPLKQVPGKLPLKGDPSYISHPQRQTENTPIQPPEGKTGNTFTCFPRLPQELQLAILQSCLTSPRPVVYHDPYSSGINVAVLWVCKLFYNEGRKIFREQNIFVSSQPIYLVADSSLVTANRPQVITSAEGQNLADDLSMRFIELSTRDLDSVNALMDEVFRGYYYRPRPTVTASPYLTREQRSKSSPDDLVNAVGQWRNGKRRLGSLGRSLRQRISQLFN